MFDLSVREMPAKFLQALFFAALALCIVLVGEYIKIALKTNQACFLQYYTGNDGYKARYTLQYSGNIMPILY